MGYAGDVRRFKNCLIGSLDDACVVCGKRVFCGQTPVRPQSQLFAIPQAADLFQ